MVTSRGYAIELAQAELKLLFSSESDYRRFLLETYPRAPLVAWTSAGKGEVMMSGKPLVFGPHK